MASENHLARYIVAVLAGLTVAAIVAAVSHVGAAQAWAWLVAFVAMPVSVPAWSVGLLLLVTIALFVAWLRTEWRAAPSETPATTATPVSPTEETLPELRPLPSAQELTASQAQLLTLFAEHDGADLTVPDLAARLKRDRILIAYDVDELKHRKFLLDFYANGGPFYRLAAPGRKYAVEHRLIG